MSPEPRRTRRPRRPQGRLTSTPVKLGGFAAGLTVLFGAAALAGAAIAPDRGAPPAEHVDDAATKTGSGHAGDGAHERAARQDGGPQETAHPVRGLAVAENGLRLVLDNRELRRGQATSVRLRIVDERDETVRDFDLEHTKRMHLVVVRRDLSAFAHLHPEQRRDGSWSIRLTLPVAGAYRLFADFSHEGVPTTLAGDLYVDGRVDVRSLPSPAPDAVSDGGYDVRLDARDATPGKEAGLRFTITKDGRAIQPEPYLGAGGHLVALRDGDLAFLHVHPTDHGHGAGTGPQQGDAVDFAATFPTAGRYRLFAQFKHEGTVQTVAFTQEVKQP